jgi:hypothetical protein
VESYQGAIVWLGGQEGISIPFLLKNKGVPENLAILPKMISLGELRQISLVYDSVNIHNRDFKEHLPYIPTFE